MQRPQANLVAMCDGPGGDKHLGALKGRRGVDRFLGPDGLLEPREVLCFLGLNVLSQVVHNVRQHGGELGGADLLSLKLLKTALDVLRFERLDQLVPEKRRDSEKWRT